MHCVYSSSDSLTVVCTPACSSVIDAGQFIFSLLRMGGRPIIHLVIEI